MKELFTIIIVVLIGLGLGIIKLYINTMCYARDVYENTYICPNCGAHFKVRWYQIIYKWNSVYMYNAAKLKCPNCHEKDMCSVDRDQR